MELVFEEFYKSIPKFGEEVCGDNVEIIKKDETTLLVLSDGLGSGIKANILSTLTAKIAIGLLDKELPLQEIVSTILETLPVCENRGTAFATLAVLKVDKDRQVRLIEIDTPSAFIVREGKVIKANYREFKIANRLVRETKFKLNETDLIFLVSDGVVHAGIGGILNFGLGWQGFAERIAKITAKNEKLELIINKLTEICKAYYDFRPGDDFTIAGMKFREKRKLILLTGPPKNKSDDQLIINKFKNFNGKKIISGGTTAAIAARELKVNLEVSLEYPNQKIPPEGKLSGIDLVTEGLLTLNSVLEQLTNYKQGQMLPEGKDGATKLLRMLLESDQINFLVGRAVNESHQNLNLPISLGVRSQIVDRLAENLKRLQKDVNIEWY